MSTRGGRGHGGNWGLGFSTAGFGRTGANWRVNEATGSQVSYTIGHFLEGVWESKLENLMRDYFVTP